MPSDLPPIGDYSGVPFEEYAAWPAVNWSTLKGFRQSCLQGHFEMLHPRDSIDQMRTGQAFHTAILEPDKFDGIYATMPRFEGHPNSNAYKAQKNDWIEANKTKVSLDADEMACLRGQQRAVMAHPTTSALLSGKGRNEISIVWQDEITGVMCKGRIDRLTRIPASVLDPELGGFVVAMLDLKTTSKFHWFDKQVADYGYHGQLAFYRDGLRRVEQHKYPDRVPAEVTPLIVPVESDPPHDTEVRTCSDAVDHGRKLYRRLLDQLVACRKSGSWPGVCPVGARAIELAKYSLES